MDSITYKGTVYPWQCDHIGHMNIMWYVSKFDEANWNFFATLGADTALSARATPRHGSGPTEHYKRELLAGDIVEVRSRVLEVGEKSLRFLHEMWNIDARELAASCELTGVHMDRRERKAVPFPEAVRDAALANIAAAG